ncbi:hypothetical protein GBZ86_03770 [Clostridium tarantellae]|uniref:Uncharacterized protein n=2 Tax=Clostridium tarantellae TaxID=39493 RepID=A0A6I1MKY6_9CLOT|nr:hypothetical protein [Clostridium tarantellae]
MSNSNKLMKKLFLFILNVVLILVNALALYGYLEAVFKKNFEMVMLSLAILPIGLIIGVIFYFLKHYLNISRLNRKLPILTIGVYIITTFIDEAIIRFMRVTGIISNIGAISIPTYPGMITIMILGIILLLITVICTFKSLVKI